MLSSRLRPKWFGLTVLSGATSLVSRIPPANAGGTTRETDARPTEPVNGPWGAVIFAVPGQRDITSLAYGPDGTVVATGALDGTVWLRNPADPDAEPTVLVHGVDVAGVAFSPDGRTLATSGGVVRLWDLAPPDIVPPPFGFGTGPVAFSADGRTLVASHGQDVLLWDVRDPDAEPQVARHEGPVSTLALSPDGATLATVNGGAGGIINVWDTAALKFGPVVLDNEADVHVLGFTRDGKTLVSGGWNGVRLWDHADAEEPPEVLDSQLVVDAIAISSDGATLAAGARSEGWPYDLGGTLALWDLTQPSPAPVVHSMPSGYRLMDFSPDSERLAGVTDFGEVRVVDPVDPLTEPVIVDFPDLMFFELSPDRTLLACGHMDGTVWLWDLGQPDAAPLVFRGHEDWAWAVAFSEDGRYLVTGGRDGTARVWDLHRFEAAPIILADQGAAVVAVGVSSDGQLVVTATDDGAIRLWDPTQPGGPLLVMHRQDEPISDLALSADGSLLASGSSDGTVWLWPLDDPTLATKREYEGEVRQLTFSPDGQTLAVSGADGTIWLSNLGQRDGVTVALPGHQRSVLGLTFSLDGTMLVSTADRSVLLWLVARPDATPIALRRDGTDAMLSPVFSPDGTSLTAVSAGGIVWQWELEPAVATPVAG